MIDDFSIWIIATVSSEGVRRRAKPKTMANYDLLSSTIENEFLKNYYSPVIATLILRNSVKCEGALTFEQKIKF